MSEEKNLEEVKKLSDNFYNLQESTSKSIAKFGERIGNLESHNKVQDERIKNLQIKIDEMGREMVENRIELKQSILELKSENKESMNELKQRTKEILDAVTPMTHEVNVLNNNYKEISYDVDRLKEKPAKTWETIKDKSLGWIVVLILGIIAVALGLGKYV